MWWPQYNCSYSLLVQIKTGHSSSKEAAPWLEKVCHIPVLNTVAPQWKAGICNDASIHNYGSSCTESDIICPRNVEVSSSYLNDPTLFEAIDYTKRSCELSQPKLTDMSITVQVHLHTGSYITAVCILIHSALSAAFVVSTDKPTINVTKLPKTIPVFNGYPEELVCDADGNPPPHIVWLRNANGEPCGFGTTLTVSEEGFYRCNATNALGSVTRQVKVILKGKGTCAFNNTVQCRSCCHLNPFPNKKKKRELHVHAFLQSIFFSQASSAVVLNLLWGKASFLETKKQKTKTYSQGETHRASRRNSSRFRSLYHRCAVWFVWALWCYNTWEKDKI